MQTFLPYPDFTKSLMCLDNKRLGKQRVECLQILNALEGKTKGWRNHPASIMWQNHIEALKLYHDLSIIIWVARGFKNTMPMLCKSIEVELPDWLGDKDFHASHRSNLLRKDKEHYGKFGWKEPDNLPYIWPL